jgi:hypothetical protein
VRIASAAACFNDTARVSAVLSRFMGGCSFPFDPPIFVRIGRENNLSPGSCSAVPAASVETCHLDTGEVYVEVTGISIAKSQMPSAAVTQSPWVILLLAPFVACGSRSPAIRDPVPGIPATQQRTVTRSDFRWHWPFAVGVGTLGCDSGAVVLQTGGVTYALNDAAKARGFASVQPLQISVSSGPRNPLARLKQGTRMQIFARAIACSRMANESPSTASACSQRLRDTHGLSDDELTQIEAEGAERRWPPLPPEYRSLAPLVDAGLKLCPA